MNGAVAKEADGYWEHYDHDADIGVRGVGWTMRDAFVQAALGLTAVVCDPSRVAMDNIVKVSCDASGSEALFVEWLNTLIFEMATRSMLFSRFELQIRGNTLSARIYGESIDREKHQPVVEVKGATYTDLKVTQQKEGCWVAQCVVDV
ncbi:MAG: archease [Gammaproteobacteria bacterium]|nr:archease [Gammaproteobacteria bacterium]